MTKDEFLSLQTGDSVRVVYNGITGDFVVERTQDAIVLHPDGCEIVVPFESVDRWNIGSVERRRGKGRRAAKAAE